MIIYMEEDNSRFTGQYEDKKGFGQCYICGTLSHIKYTQNDKGQVLEETKQCITCEEEWK